MAAMIARVAPCWLLGALALICGWTLVSCSHGCGGYVAQDVQYNWNKLFEVLTTDGRVNFMQAVGKELKNLDQEASKEFPAHGDTADEKALALRLLTEVSSLINLLDDSDVLWKQVRHVMTYNADMGGGRARHIPTLMKAMDPVLTYVSGDFGGDSLTNWRVCVEDLEDMIRDIYLCCRPMATRPTFSGTVQSLIGDERNRAATCQIKAETGDPSKPVRGTIFFTQKNYYQTTIKIYLQGFTKKGSKHGFHIHTEGATGNACKDAGGHFNPDKMDHGGPMDDERHVGDLGNVIVDSTGSIEVTLKDRLVALSGKHSVIGRSVVVHALEDDLGRGGFPDSKTTGHAGARLGCCIIKPLTLQSAEQSTKAHHHWTYHGPHGPYHWADDYPSCGGVRQSPVNIDSASALEGGAEAFRFSEAYTTGHVMELTNNGHSAQVALAGDYRVSGGSLPGTFKAAQFHFHWGSNNDRGSEHTVDGKPFPLEMHIVHMNSRFDKIKDALNDDEGLAVLGVFFKVQDDDNKVLGPVIDHLKDVKNPDGVVTLDSVVLASLLPNNLADYYRYYGGLTTPPCSEAVIFTLFTEPLGISSSQLEAFRSLLNDDYEPLIDNFRPVQPLNARQIFHRGSV